MAGAICMGMESKPLADQSSPTALRYQEYAGSVPERIRVLQEGHLVHDCTENR